MLLEQPIEVPQEKPENFSTLPEGDYLVVITDFIERIASGPNLSGRVFDITYQVVEGPHHGETLTDFCPLLADQPKHREWGARTLSKIAWACGLGGRLITDTSQVENIPLVVRVSRIEEQYVDRATGEEKTATKNKINDYIDQKSWLAAKRESESPAKSGYQSRKTATAEQKPASGYAAGKRQRKAATPAKPKIEFIADPNDPRVADYPYEIEAGQTQLWLDENGTVWELQAEDLKNFVRYYDDADDTFEERKPVDDFEVMKP